MTTTTIRPDGVAVAVAVAAVGAASINAALSDNSDGSYGDYTPGGFGAYVYCTLGTFALPAGSVVKNVVVRARGSVAGTTLSAYAYDATLGQIGSGLVTALSASIATYTGVTDAVTLSQAQVDALQVAVFLSNAGRVHEAYVDVTYALIPSCTVSLPTGAQATSTPTCTWAYTGGSDGGVQSRYQVRVFTAAQYGIGGFDPAVSPNTYDSGIVSSAATSLVLPSLANGTTFKAYVAVAQTINGTPQWGAWTVSPVFNIAVTTSDITSIVPTPDNTNAKIALLVTRNGGTPAWTTLEVQRTDDGGTTWAPIRGTATNGAVGVAVSGATWPLTDYESANAATVTYRARASYISGGQTITGAWVSSSSTSWTAAADWLKDCRLTTRNRTVKVRVNPTVDRVRPQGVLVVIGRSDPVVVSDVRHTRSGVLEFVTYTDTEAVDFLTLTTGDVLLLQTRPGNRFGAAYVAIAGPTEVPAIPEVGFDQNRFWSVPFVEVLKPIDVGIV